MTEEQVRTIKRMQAEGATKAAMSRATGLSRPTVYGVLGSYPPLRPLFPVASSDRNVRLK